MSLARWLAPTCLAILPLAAGVSTPSPVPVIAPAGDVAALAGEWRGEYSGSSGRSGSIVFSLTAGRDTAYGDVAMVPTGGEPLLAAETGRPGAVTRPSSRALTIRFVRIAGDSVSGWLDPYQAPDCNCVLTTTFMGRANGDRIDGTFRTVGDPRATGAQEGRWTVTRRR